MYTIYANPEHVHFLVSLRPEMSEHELANLVADASEIFIDNNQLCTGQFRWQRSCFAFSVSKEECVTLPVEVRKPIQIIGNKESE